MALVNWDSLIQKDSPSFGSITDSEAFKNYENKKSFAGVFNKLGESYKNEKDANKKGFISASKQGALTTTQLIANDTIDAYKKHVETINSGVKIKDNQQRLEMLLDKLGEQDPSVLLSDKGVALIKQYFPEMDNEKLTKQFIPSLYKRQSVINQLKSVPMGTKFSTDQIQTMAKLGISNPEKHMSLWGGIAGGFAQSLSDAIKGQAQTSSSSSNPLSPLKAKYDLQDETQKQADALKVFSVKDKITTDNNIAQNNAQTQAVGQQKKDLAAYQSELANSRDVNKHLMSVEDMGKKFDQQLKLQAMKSQAAGTKQGIQENKFIQSLRQEFNNDEVVKDYKIAANSYNKMLSVWNQYQNEVNSGKDANNTKMATHQAMIYMFQKLLDSRSTVRESEYKQTSQGQPVVDAARGYLEKLKTGGSGVIDQNMSGILEVAHLMLQGSSSLYQNRVNFYSSEANNANVSPSRVVNSQLDNPTPPPNAKPNNQTNNRLSNTNSVGTTLKTPGGSTITIKKIK